MVFQSDRTSLSGAQILLKRPLVEIRRGISLGLDPPTEKSSVLALTAPSGNFVDIRWSLEPDSKSSFTKDPYTIGGYATAGMSTATVLPGTKSCLPYECTIHVKWEHPIDSSQSFTTDGADMYLLANHDVMEIGTVEIEGRVHMFREYWLKPKEEAQQLPCVVVEFDGGDSNPSKGMVIRVGDFCQGVLQRSDQFWLERWQVKERGGSWIRDDRSNTIASENVLPCKWAFEDARAIGDCVTTQGKTWTVTEVFDGSQSRG